MRLVTLGTSCAQQTLTRTQSAHALCLSPALTYLFDCGSATATALLNAGIKGNSISKIFITHLHTDHVIGLPGLLTDILGGHGGKIAEFQEGKKREGPPRRIVDVYGPLGIKELLRTTFRVTYTMLASSFRVHELLFQEDPANTDEPFLREEGSRDIRIDGGLWAGISIDDACQISAVPILHSVPSLGYVITEDDTVSIPHEYVRKVRDTLVDRRPELQNAWKTLKSGQELVMDDETLPAIPREKGRQIVILGDTCDASPVLKHVNPPVSLVLHESTNAYLPGYGSRDDETLESVRTRAIERGHSTPEIAGEFARKCESQLLILTHFSSRYSGADNYGAVKVMHYFERLAALAGSASQKSVETLFEKPPTYKGKRPKVDGEDSSKTYNGKVIAAWDGMFIDIPKTGIMLSSQQASHEVSEAELS